MTMHIDEEVLDRVMKITGAKTKTAAVELALTEMARRHKMKELFSEGLGMTPEELRNAIDPASYPEWRGAESMAAETGPASGASENPTADGSPHPAG